MHRHGEPGVHRCRAIERYKDIARGRRNRVRTRRRRAYSAGVKRRVSLVCLDVDGTLTDGVGGPALPGAAAALRRLRNALPVRLVTNTTSVPHAALARHLIGLELLDNAESLWTPAVVARRTLPQLGHDAGILLVEDAARPDYEWFREGSAGPAVVLATEGHG